MLRPVGGAVIFCVCSLRCWVCTLYVIHGNLLNMNRTVSEYNNEHTRRAWRVNLSELEGPTLSLPLPTPLAALPWRYPIYAHHRLTTETPHKYTTSVFYLIPIKFQWHILSSNIRFFHENRNNDSNKVQEKKIIAMS